METFLKSNWLTTQFAMGGLALGTYGTRPGRAEIARNGQVSYFTVPQPLHFVLTWIVVGTVVFALWRRVIASVLASRDRLHLL